MHKSIPNGLLGALLALFLAACGGGTPPPSSSITLTVEDPGNTSKAAYQVGTGSWQTLSMTTSGTTKTGTFNLNGQAQYGVAVRCGTTPTQVKVIQATSTELANPKVVCSTSIVPFAVTVNTDSGLLAVGDKVCVYQDIGIGIGIGTCQSASETVNLSLNLKPGSNRDLLVTLQDSSDLVKVAKVKRNVNVTNGGSTSVSLGSSDKLDPVSFTVPSAPSGYTSSGASVFYLSANGTASGSVKASTTSYRPVSGFGSGDLYRAFISSYNYSAGVVSSQFFTSSVPTLAFPTPWNNGSLTVTQTAHPTVTGLNRSDADLQGYAISLTNFGQFYYFYYTATLSKAWLGSATSYALPDLSSLLGYTPLTNNSTPALDVTALLSNKAVLEFNPSGFANGDYIRLARAFTSITVGNTNNVSFPQ